MQSLPRPLPVHRWPQTGALKGAPKIRSSDVTEAALANAADAAIEAEVQVYGRILDRLGTPVAGALVTVRADLLPGLSTNEAEARSGADGRYRVSYSRAGQLRVEAQHRQAGRGIGGPVVAVPGSAHEVDVTLGRGFVRGAVIWDDGKAAADVVVRGAIRGRARLTATTDAAGRYEIGPFAAGEVIVNAAPDPDAVGASADTARTVTIAPGADGPETNLVIPRRDQQITGVVLSPSGQPMPAIAIGIVRAERSSVLGSISERLSADGNFATISDPDGGFVVKGLPSGSFTLWASTSGYPDAEAREVQAGATGVRLQFARDASLSGRAFDETGAPCVAYTLYLGRLSVVEHGAADFSPAKVIRNSDGSFTVSALRPGAYELLARTPDQRVGRLAGLTLVEGEARENLILVVDEGASVSGRVVVEQTGQLLAGVWLGSSIPKARARTDAAGVFIFKGIPTGTFEIYLPRNRRTMEAQDEIVEVPRGVRKIDVGVLQLRPDGS